jgi:hypothetical protein
MSAKMLATVTDYDSALEFLNGAKEKKIGHNTFVKLVRDEEICIVLHATEIVRYHPDKDMIDLWSDGWNSTITVHRMHAFTPDFIRVNKRSNDDGESYMLVTSEKEIGPMVWDGFHVLPLNI